ncbi:MAG: SPOR domain-containing protein [Bacteroidetes bacterium]|nr:SPOR domain-containing protein [Bacteroidota bacterium]
MLSIEEILSELLLNHSCVIIPKFGGFVAKQTSAKIDLEHNLVIPPSKHLLFNKHLIANDGLLVNELATKNKLSFQDSESRVSTFVDEINNQLKASKHYELPKIGVFHFDTEGNITFVQDRYFNFLLNAYGLNSVQFISKQQVEKTEVEIEKETPVIPIAEGKRKLWKYAAAACLLPLAFYSIWIPTRANVLESGLISHKDFNPFYKQETGSYEKKPLAFSKEILSKSFEEKITLEPDSYFADFQLDSNHKLKVRMNEKMELVQNETENNNPINSETAIEVQNSNDSKKFQYVLGSFANPTNASNFYNKLKNAGLEVKKSSAGSLIRITVGATNDLDSLQEEISKANNLGYQGWILKN